MDGEELKQFGQQLAALTAGVGAIKEGWGRHEQALIDVFEEHKKHLAKITSLDTVVRMSLAEQKRINETFVQNFKELEECQTELGKCWLKKDKEIDKEVGNIEKTLGDKIQKVEKRYAYVAGAAAVILIVLNIALRLWP